MATQKIRFGFCVPIFAHPGTFYFRTPAYKKLDWKTTERAALYAERLGYDSLFVADHLFLGHNGEIWEAITTMSALAAKTKKIEIFPIHLCDGFRNPALLAKMFATLSHISNGRIGLFYDYGWRKKEFDAYGFDFMRSNTERIRRMGEGLRVIRGLWSTHAPFSFQGKHYRVRDTIFAPKPVRSIPIWMGEVDNPKMVEEIVRHADVFNSTPCTPNEFDRRIGVLRKECSKQKRRFSNLGLSLETQVLIRGTEKELKNTVAKIKVLKKGNRSFDSDKLKEAQKGNPDLASGSLASLKNEFFVGTPQEVLEKMRAFTKRGVSHFMFWFMDYPDYTSMELLAKKVLPHFKK